MDDRHNSRTKASVQKSTRVRADGKVKGEGRRV